VLSLDLRKSLSIAATGSIDFPSEMFQLMSANDNINQRHIYSFGSKFEWDLPVQVFHDVKVFICVF